MNLSSQVLLFMNVCTACVRLRYLGNLSATQALKFFSTKTPWPFIGERMEQANHFSLHPFLDPAVCRFPLGTNVTCIRLFLR